MIYIKNDTIRENKLGIGGENFIREDAQDRLFKGKRTDIGNEDKRKQRRIIEDTDDDVDDENSESSGLDKKAIFLGFLAGAETALALYFMKRRPH